MSEEMILAYVENKKLPRGELTFLTWLLSKMSLDCSTFGFDLSQCTIIGIRFPFIMCQP